MDKHCESPTAIYDSTAAAVANVHTAGAIAARHVRTASVKMTTMSAITSSTNADRCETGLPTICDLIKWARDIVCRCTAEGERLAQLHGRSSSIQARTAASAKIAPVVPNPRTKSTSRPGGPCRASFADTTTGSSGAGPESRDASLSSETDVDINRSMKPCGLPTSKTAPSATYFQNQRLVTAAISAAVAGNPRLRYPRS